MPNTTIQLKKSSTPSATPSSLANGELAINFADGKLFYKNTAGFIAEISGAGGGGGNSFGTVNANSTLIVSDTSGDVLTIVPGNNIVIVGDAVNDKLTIGLSDGVVANIQAAFDKANSANITAIAAFNKANSINVFTALTDVPSSYANSAGYIVTVNPGGTGLQFSQDISLDELIHSARVAPTVVANDSVTVYVTASGTTPNREVAYKIKNEYGEEVIISSILV